MHPISSKPTSDFYASSRNFIGRSLETLDSQMQEDDSQLNRGRLWTKYCREVKTGNQKRGQRVPSGEEKDSGECISQLISNPVQYFTQQWLLAVHEVEQRADRFHIPVEDSWKLPSESWKSKKPEFDSKAPRLRSGNHKDVSSASESEVMSEKGERWQQKRTVSVQTPREMLLSYQEKLKDEETRASRYNQDYRDNRREHPVNSWYVMLSKFIGL